ncbi:hypothetical protein M422DRAFT_228655 [Sphaerobolus stellatus SS14]|uniref:NAD-dependent epimerase/dehydratase domain-containing protein n=1 Tax=Sphaerobolus stellatus (strain SS14) TaxID=990650 RepID=A0A0C9VYF8_SPHS4|nr:hypothetical protein M422DRAFT_228655 [Sphaerobolus stellatus SS14]
MAAAAQKLLVIGGNGYVGSAVCRAALARGWDVASISSSGKAFRTPKGHTPSWTNDVQWHTASALEPPSYRSILRDRTAIVHTVGILLETGKYKQAIKEGNIGGLVKAFLPGSNNPLKKGTRESPSYEMLNRDTALTVCETYRDVMPSGKPHTFVYVSAEDLGRPFVPRRYIETKREAEQGIQKICAGTDIRSVFIRPSFIYHPHLRPISSPMAALMDLSATIHNKAPSIIPTPSRILRALSSDRPEGELPDAARALAETMELPPVHLDHVADAICKSIEDPAIHGVVGLKRIRKLVGWKNS